MIATHYTPDAEPPWIALDMEVANDLVTPMGADPIGDLVVMMEGWCRLLDDENLIGYGQTEQEASMDALTKAEDYKSK